MKNLSLLGVCLISLFSLLFLPVSIIAAPIDSMSFENVLSHFVLEMKTAERTFQKQQKMPANKIGSC